ncbi:MAG: ornithine--oxo-acid transaminase [Candidatus Spechtbacteria bacterium]|nr:ornithine--oxo-acid transaminase [Candidatus Spechtbacteria bacterium]
MSKTSDLVGRIEQSSAHHYKRFSGTVFARAKGAWLWDVEGCKYLDMLATYSAVSIGHNHPRIKRVLRQQLAVVGHAFYFEQEAAYLQILTQVSGMEAALLMNTGVEAVETAIKLARKWAYTRKRVELNRAEIIFARDNFHGRTIGVIGGSSEEQYYKLFGPYPTFAYRVVPFGDTDMIKSAITPCTAAVLLEPIQGEGGIHIPPAGYLAEVKEICKKQNVLFMLDEVQTGFGRTGSMFAFEHEDVRPDVLIVGKALGGGTYPVSAILASRHLMDVFEPGDHGSTWGGNAMACAIGTETIKIIQEEGLVDNSAKMGECLKQRLLEITAGSPLVKEVRGRGLLVGIELAKEAGKADDWCARLLELGIICKGAHDKVIRLAPPLVINRRDLDFFLGRFKQVLRERENSR